MICGQLWVTNKSAFSVSVKYMVKGGPQSNGFKNLSIKTVEVMSVFYAPLVRNTTQFSTRYRSSSIQSKHETPFPSYLSPSRISSSAVVQVWNVVLWWTIFSVVVRFSFPVVYWWQFRIILDQLCVFDWSFHGPISNTKSSYSAFPSFSFHNLIPCLFSWLAIILETM